MYNWFVKYRDENGLNLLNPKKVKQGFYWYNSSQIEDSTKAYIEKISVLPLSNYGITSLASSVNIIDSYSFYDSDGVFISQSGTSQNTSSIAVPDGAYFVTLNITSQQSGVNPNDFSFSLNSANFEPFFVSRKISPVYNKASRSYSKESGKEFYREQLQGNIKLIREDYDYVNNLSIEQKILIEIQDTTGGLDDFQGEFYKTDCKWDQDNRVVEIKIETSDNYVNLLAGLDKTYNLLDLDIFSQEISYDARPIYQFYIPGDSTITNTWGGLVSTKEIQIDPLFSDSDIESYDFELLKTLYYIPRSDILAPNVAGTYGGNVSVSPSVTWAARLESSDASDNEEYFVEETDSPFPGQTRFELFKIVNSNKIGLYASASISGSISNSFDWFELGYVGINGQGGSFIFLRKKIFARTLHNSKTPSYLLEQNPSFDFSFIKDRLEDDIYEQNNNYKYVSAGFVEASGVIIKGSTRSKKTRTIYGVVPDVFSNEGEAYTRPTQYRKYNDATGQFEVDQLVFDPVNQVTWGEMSIWAGSVIEPPESGQTHPSIGATYRNQIKLRDSYSVFEVINALLLKIDSDVVFRETSYHSEFLFSALNPLGFFSCSLPTSTFFFFDRVDNFDLYITPKSNVVSANYDQPAKTAEITLSQVFSMLESMYQLHWHLEGRDLRIEHVSWYRNGGSYTGKVIGSDITSLLQRKNNKFWGFNTNNYSFDKVTMPERLEFGFADDCSEAFTGEAIEILSPFVSKGNIDDKTVQGFTNDIDYILANSNDISKSGFVCFACDPATKKAIWKVQNIGLKNVFSQNAFSGFPFSHSNFYIYDLPANNVVINGIEKNIASTNVSRYKKQEVSYPVQSNINPYELIKTNLGDGIVDKYEINLESRIVKATIKHDTE